MRVILILGLLCFFASCSSTLDFHVPTQSFSSPEVVGKTLAVKTQASFSNSTKYRLARLEQAAIFSSQVNVSTEEGTTKDNVFNATLGLGLGNAVEATYRAYTDSPDLLGAKVQIVGRDGVKKNEGIKLSVFGGYGSGEVDNKTLSASNGSGTTREYNSVLDIKAYELGTSLGYRVNQYLLPYLSYAYRSYDSEGTLTSSGLSDQVINGRAKVQSAQVGILLSKEKLFLQFEGGFAKSKWRDAEERDDYTLGASLGLQFASGS